MTRQTSIDAYNAVKTSGIVGRLQQKVYDVIFNHGPLTAQEAWHILRDAEAKNGTASINGITPRFSELKEMGLAYEVGERNCNITKRNCIVWDVTSKLPQKPPTKVTKPQQIEAVRKVLLDIHWRVKHGVPIDLPSFEEESKKLLELLKTGTVRGS